MTKVKRKAPKLIPIPFEKENGRNDHLSENKSYLVKFANKWYGGTFTKQLYGWNFNGIYDSGCQLSYEGWQEIFEIVE